MSNLFKKVSNNMFFLQSFMEQMGVSVIITDLNFKIIYVNKATEDLFGYSKKEFIDSKPYLLHYGDDCNDIQMDLNKKISDGELWQGRMKNRRKDGKIIFVEITAFPFINEKNEISAYIGFQKDVTERVKIENKYYDIFKNAPRLITLVYEDGTLKDCNDRIDILGYTKEEVIGKHISIFFSNISKEEAFNTLDDLFSNSKKGVDKEYVMIKKTGEEIDVSIKSADTIDEEGQKYKLCFIADITKQKNAERNLIKTALDLKCSNEELEQFAYIASHDLQEPLRAVSSYCQLLKEKEYGRVDEESKKFFDYIINSSFRMKTLIKELLDYSRVGRRDKPFEKIYLQELLSEVLNDFDVLIRDLKAEIIIESEMPYIIAVRFRIKQLLYNIISNSLKFRGAEPPIIRIGCCEDSSNDDCWLFYIKDNGIGIDSEYYDRIFGVFKRLYSRDEYPGTGIGLALCKRIVETHGGKIWVESEHGRGTYMYFTIAKSLEVVED